MKALGSCGWVSAIAALMLLAPSGAHALDFAPGGASVELLNAAGQPDARAGAHPDRMVLEFHLEQGAGPEEQMREIVAEMPPGFSGDPAAVPPCPREVFARYPDDCPPESQVGWDYFGLGEEKHAVYSVETGPNETALFGAVIFFSIKMGSEVRAGDQGVNVRVQGLPQFEYADTRHNRVELWGVPADHQEGTSIPRRPLITTPTRCGEPFAVRVGFRTWQRPDSWVRTSTDTGLPLSGCGALPFEPATAIALDRPVADSPTGARIDLSAPQNDDPDGRASSQIESARVALPEGMTISPGAAAGAVGCGDAEFGLGAAGEPACPPASRIGAATMRAPQLPRPLLGEVYLGEEHPGERFRMLVYAQGGGVEVKMAGELRADPQTGRLTAELTHLPQSPFEQIDLRLEGGPEALLATPLTCGAAATSATFTPYSGGAAVESPGSVAIGPAPGAGCDGPAPFAPDFEAALGEDRAGAPTSFATVLRRRDGEQLQERFAVTLPAGTSAALGEVEPCPPAAAAAGGCGAGSRIGGARAQLGPGTRTASLRGDVYLTGPYRGAPYGVALSFPARIGSFQLDPIVVRGALRVDPLSGQVTIATDRLPRLVSGIAVRFRSIRLDVDRPGFLRNPTSCLPGEAAATVSAFGGAVARLASPLRSRGCVDLPFRPRMRMALRGRARQLRAHGKPALRLRVRMRGRGANLRAADFSLPAPLGFDASALRAICARGRAAAGRCPAGARVGSGTAWAPLLGAPLRGGLYVVQPPGKGIPDLWLSLRGAGLRMEMRMRTRERDGRLEARLRDLPDFPLRSLALRIAGGRNGVIELDRGLCRRGKPRRLRSPLRLEGQNAAVKRGRLAIANPARCGGE